MWCIVFVCLRLSGMNDADVGGGDSDPEFDSDAAMS